MMKQVGRALCLMTLFLVVDVMSMGFASAAVVVNGVTWTHGYEGNVVPNDPSSQPGAWDLVTNTGTTSQSISQGILNISTNGINSNLLYRQLPSSPGGPHWAPTGIGSTLEARIRVVDSGDLVGIQSIDIRDGDRLFRFLFSHDTGVFTGVRDMLNEQFVAADIFQFHTYRVTVNEAANLASLYVDGATTPAFTTSGIAASFTLLDFGDQSSGDWDGQVEYDYIRWTNQGAFSPIPEPATAMLFGLTLIVFFRYSEIKDHL